MRLGQTSSDFLGNKGDKFGTVRLTSRRVHSSLSSSPNDFLMCNSNDAVELSKLIEFQIACLRAGVRGIVTVCTCIAIPTAFPSELNCRQFAQIFWDGVPINDEVYWPSVLSYLEDFVHPDLQHDTRAIESYSPAAWGIVVTKDD